MFKKNRKTKIDIKYRLVITLCLGLVIFGLLDITNGIPQFMKDKSVFSLNYDYKPLDVKVKAGNYSMYFNEAILVSGENSVHNFFANIEIEVFKIVNTVTTVTHIK